MSSGEPRDTGSAEDGAAGAMTATDPSTTDVKDELFERVASVIAETQEIPRESVSRDAKFAELGIDSLNAFNLLCDLEEELGVVIPDDEAHQLSSVGQLVELVHGLQAVPTLDQPLPPPSSTPAG